MMGTKATPRNQPTEPRLKPNRKLQALRINCGLSPNDLGYRAGVSGKTIRFVESGHKPTPRVQFAIAEVFDLLPLDLWPLHEQRPISRTKGYA